MSHEPFPTEEVYDGRVQKSSVDCNRNSIERVKQQFDGRKRLERISESRRVDKTKNPRLHLLKIFLRGTTSDV